MQMRVLEVKRDAVLDGNSDTLITVEWRCRVWFRLKTGVRTYRGFGDDWRQVDTGRRPGRTVQEFLSDAFVWSSWEAEPKYCYEWFEV